MIYMIFEEMNFKQRGDAKMAKGWRETYGIVRGPGGKVNVGPSASSTTAVTLVSATLPVPSVPRYVITYRVPSKAEGEMADRPTSMAVHSICSGNPGAFCECTSRAMQVPLTRRASP
jgi:hypothetical protein